MSCTRVPGPDQSSPTSRLRDILRRDGYLSTQGTNAVTIFGSWNDFLSCLGKPDTGAGSINAGDHGPAGTIRVIHQPNFLAGFNIAGLLGLGGMASRTMCLPVTFTGLDYDTFGNHAFRSAVIPDIRGETAVYLGRLAPRKNRRKIAMANGPAAPDVAAEWHDVLLQSARFWRRRVNRLLPATLNQTSYSEAEEAFAGHLKDLSSNRSLTTAMMTGIQQLADQCFAFRPRCFSATQLVTSHAPEIQVLARDVLAYAPDTATRLVWRACPNCHERAPAHVSERRRSLVATWQCPNCGQGGKEPLEFVVDDPAVGPWPRFIPQVLLCDLVDLILLPAAAAISYAGGLSHAVRSRQLAARISGLTPYPEFFWDPAEMFTGYRPAGLTPTVDRLWATGKTSAWWYRLVYGPMLLSAALLEREIDSDWQAHD